MFCAILLISYINPSDTFESVLLKHSSYIRSVKLMFFCVVVVVGMYLRSLSLARGN